MKNENMQGLQKYIKELKERGASESEFTRMIISSIALSLAQIADLMIDRNEAKSSIIPDNHIAKWHRVIDGNWVYSKCSSCGSLQDVKSNYCPNCGAKMEVSEDGKSI